MKIRTLILITILMALCLTSACHRHTFTEATCTENAICECGEFLKPAFGHTYENGACINCGAEDPDYFNPEKYGFENNYGMTKWIRITAYNLGGDNAYAETYDKMSYDFKDGVMSFGYNENPMSAIKEYRVVDNDNIVQEDGDTFTILERISDFDGNLILRVASRDYDKYRFALADQIDWDRSPEVVDEYRGPTVRYYFKKEQY